MGIVARQGNITDAHTTVVVNAGNTSLWLGSGVAGAIKRAGGPSIQQELDRIQALKTPRRKVPQTTRIGEFRHFTVDLGDVVVTHAGNMHARFVYHAAVMDCEGSTKGKTDTMIVRMATVNCMLEARRMSVRSIAFPIFGTGVGGLSIPAATEAMLGAIKDYWISDMYVGLYAFTDADYGVIDPMVRAFRSAEYHN